MKERVLLIYVIVSTRRDCVRIDCVVLFGDMEYPVLGRLAIYSFPTATIRVLTPNVILLLFPSIHSSRCRT